MAFVRLIFRSAFRNRLRTLLTALGVSIAIVAFLFMRTFIAAWYAGVDATAADRMITRNKTSIIFTLPRTYVEKVRNMKGVADASWANWFGGIYIDERNFFAQFAIDAESFYRLYPEYVLTPAEKKAWMEDRSGCVVGEQIAEKYNWKVGDKITLKGAIYPGDWDFTVRGIYHGGEKATDRQQFHFHWAYLNDRAPERMREQIGWVVFKVAPGSGEIGANIDQAFANSTAETHTESEKSFQLSFISMVSALISAIQVISGVVLFILFLILANTLAMATRERTVEYAAMRAIGFRPIHVIVLVLGEGFVIAALGVAGGLLLAPPILHYFADIFQTNMGSFLGSFELDPIAMVAAMVVAIVGGMIASVFPAWRAGRLNIVDALRRIE